MNPRTATSQAAERADIAERTADATPEASVDLLALENQVCFALAVAARGVIGLYRPILEPLGLTHPQYLVMLALWQRSPRTVRDLGEALQLEPATLSPLLKRLEAQGYVTRERSARDERALDVALTDAGTALRAKALAIPPQVVDRLGMSLDELAGLRDRLTEVIAAVQRGG
jgi:DNA-binding MarR family transcriptional regulator